MSAKAALHDARTLAGRGDIAAAARVATAFTAANPLDAEGFFVLGQIHAASGDAERALAALATSESLAPHNPLAALGQVALLRDHGRLSDAHAALDRAVAAAPQLPDQHHQRALLLQCEGRFDEARAAFERELASASKPSGRLLNNYGNVLKQLGDTAAAVAAFGRAIDADSGYQLAYRNLGDTLFYDGQMQAAEAVYRTMTERFAVTDFEVWRRWGHTLNNIGQTDLAENAWQHALDWGDTERMTAHALLFQLKRRNATDAALTLAERILARDAHDVAAAVAQALMLPAIYDSRGEAEDWRTRYRSGLAELTKRSASEFRADDILNLAWSNFHLAYQGEDDLPLQQALGDTLGNWLDVAAPQFRQPLPRPARRGRIRIGFWSSFLRDCTVGKYFESWVTDLPRDSFEVVVFHASFVEDTLVSKFRQAAARHIRVVGAPAIHAQTILDQRLDVLLYPEVGMDSATAILTNLRLAPVQMAAWGHPVTTGATEIDHYLSVAAMEPPEHASHYREPVHLLPGLGTRYSMPTLAASAAMLGRDAFGLPQHRVLLLVPQSAFKIHPDNDALFAEVLAACPLADIVMFEDAAPANTVALDARMASVMARQGIDWPARRHLLPRGDHQRYLAVNRWCDVMLDTLYWSGGNTSLDALSMGLPVVTLPGRFMRGRQSMAMLQLMGVTETIAKSEAEFVEVTMALANSQALRDELRTQISANTGQLFDDRTPVVALAEWLRLAAG